MKIKKLKLNRTGRDFIVGDLHGCYDKLEAELNRVDFNDTKDRLFSVGDLIDRGPDSMSCAELIYEPWFYAVQGNHERMFFTAILGDYSCEHSSNDFYHNGGGWVRAENKEEIRILAQDMKQYMHHIIYVGNRQEGFAITHAKLEDHSNIPDYNIDSYIWDRSIYNDIQNMDPRIMHNWKNESDLNYILTTYDPTKRLVYVGHNTLPNRHTILINNHMMLDTGVHKEGGKLTMVEHSAFLERIRK